ncbi:MAG: hypothetical protein SPJ86_04315, partial [Eubacteriales bacterium]|nr:hypothetical protein [Eubacteriales bacterium]
MIKQSIRLTGFIVALFSLILVFMHLQMTQDAYPFATTERFELTVYSANASKNQLVSEMNALVDQYAAKLVKVVPNQDNYINQRDIIWFGSIPPSGKSPILSEENHVAWLEPSTDGKLIHSSEMGIRPLYGKYSMFGSDEFKTALMEWCHQNEMSMDFYKPQSLMNVFMGYFIQHGIGNAVLISFFLFIT